MEKIKNIEENLDMIYLRQFCMYADSLREHVMLATVMPVEQVWFGVDGNMYKSGMRLTTNPRRESLKPRIVYP